MYDDTIPEIRSEWITHMSIEQWRAAQELEANCARSGLDAYLQAQIYLMAARTIQEKRYWHSIWLYIQAREIGSCNDLFLTVLDTGAGGVC